MNKYELSHEDDMDMHLSIRLFGDRYLYEHLVDLPLKDLQAYPKKGYRWWMGRKAKSPQALDLRDYVLHWRLVELDFRQKYSCEYLQTLSCDEMWLFLNTYIQKDPIWAYEGPIRDVMKLLFQQGKPFF